MKTYRKRKAFSDQVRVLEDIRAGANQYMQMAIYWGTACAALDAEVTVLKAERGRLGFHELIEVSNAEMNSMRSFPLIGIPVYFSNYPDGVSKVYPLPEGTKT